MNSGALAIEKAESRNNKSDLKCIIATSKEEHKENIIRFPPQAPFSVCTFIQTYQQIKAPRRSDEAVRAHAVKKKKKPKLQNNYNIFETPRQIYTN